MFKTTLMVAISLCNLLLFISPTLAQTLISDQKALDMVLQLPEVQTSLKAHASDTTVKNAIYIEREPAEDNHFYYLRLAQFFTYSDHTVTINRFQVDAKTGEIKVMEVYSGDYITLEAWRKLK